MNKQITEPCNIATALAAAQARMGKALKQADSPHFRSKYADLGNVMDACLPALTDSGIALIQPTGEDDHGRFVETILIHGLSGERLSCRVPLIVSKNDMQGYGSAVTYARRYGLMAMAGIAPEDDDGNAAAKAPPKAEDKPRKKADTVATITDQQFILLQDLIDEAGVEEGAVLKNYGATSLSGFPAAQFDRAVTKLNATIAAKKPATPDIDDEIPY